MKTCLELIKISLVLSHCINVALERFPLFFTKTSSALIMHGTSLAIAPIRHLEHISFF